MNGQATGPPAWTCQACGGPAVEETAPVCQDCVGPEIVVRVEPREPQVTLRPRWGDDDLPPAA